MSDEPRKPAGELSRDERLERALSAGIGELPENKPKGLLGDPGLNVGKTDDLTPDLNSGLSQEHDMPVLWLAIILGYLVFFVPGFVILWSTKRLEFRQKVVISAVLGVIAVALLVALRLRY